MSSKSSKSSKSSRSSMSMSRSSNVSTDNNIQPVKFGRRVIMFLCFIAIIWQLLILYYLSNLEGKECICKIDANTDWRHTYAKRYTLFAISMYIIMIVFAGTRNSKIIMILFSVLCAINFYALFTYVNDINKNNCNCAVDKQYYLNTIIRITVWGVMFLCVFGLIGSGIEKLNASKT